MFIHVPVKPVTRHCPFCKRKFKSDSGEVIAKQRFLGGADFYHECDKHPYGKQLVELVQKKFRDFSAF